VRIFRGQDVRRTGSGNIGATNVARTGSKGLAAATLLLDALKGYAAVVLAFWLAAHLALRVSDTTKAALQALDPHADYRLGAFAALFALLGHMFPIWLRFKGGKGVATALGAFLALAPTAVVICLVVFVAIVAVTRYVSLGSMLAAVVFPFAAWWLSPLTRTTTTMVLIAASSLLIIVRHKDNIRRLLAGSENRFR
jgi:glycerol-3-phosphate acyltransferase PlsY